MRRKEAIQSRHPDLDNAVKQYQLMIFSLAKTAAVRFGGCPEEYWGSLLIRLNKCLWTFKPEKGKLSTLFMYRWQQDIWAQFLRNESESRHARSCYNNAKYSGNRKNLKPEVNVSDVADLPDKVLIDNWRKDQREDGPFSVFLSHFETNNDCWDFLTKSLDDRMAMILYLKYKENMNSQEIGDELGLSRERIRQVLDDALCKLRRAMKRDGIDHEGKKSLLAKKEKGNRFEMQVL